MTPRIKNQVPLNLFPCKNCLLVVSRKYPNRKLKLIESTGLYDKLLIHEGKKIIKKETVKKMTPECRFCKGVFSHSLNS
jgi:hypothetical protein